MEPDPILSNDLTNTSTAISVLPANTYRLAVVRVEQARNKDDTGNVIKVQLKTLDDITAVDGQTVRAGWPLFDNIALTPTPNYPASSIEKNLKKFRLACGFAAGPFGDLLQYEGKIVRAKVKIQKATDEYDEANRIRGYEPAA